MGLSGGEPLPSLGPAASAVAGHPLSKSDGGSRPTSRARRGHLFGPWLFAVLGVGVVVVFFAVGGYGPSRQPGETFAPAAVAANKAVGSVAGGPWELVAAIGYAPAFGSQTSGNSTLGSGCSITPVVGTIVSSVYVPAFSGSFSSGAATWWGMFYFNPSTQHVLLVEVTEGAATPLLIASGACVAKLQNVSPVPPNLIDSSAAAATVWDQGGSLFASVHSKLSLNLEMAIAGGGTFDGYSLPGATWLIDYSPCPPLGLGGPTGSQPELEALVNATSGSLLAPFPLATSATC